MGGRSKRQITTLQGSGGPEHDRQVIRGKTSEWGALILEPHPAAASPGLCALCAEQLHGAELGGEAQWEQSAEISHSG